MDIRDQIAHNKMTSFQWLVVGLTVLLNLLDGFDLMALAFTAKSIREELNLDGATIGTLMSAGLFGMAIGSLFLSPLADKFGRRPLLLIGTGLATLGMLLTYIASSAFEIGLYRIITGLGVASILTGTNVLVSEYASQNGVDWQLPFMLPALVLGRCWGECPPYCYKVNMAGERYF